MTDQSTIVLFADVSGSVQLYEALGDEVAKRIVVELQENLSVVVEQCSGVVHEIKGDEIMCRFTQAKHSIECAAKIHQRTANYCMETDSPLTHAVQMRIGIHSGVAILDGDRLFGDMVNTAARIMSIAQAGQTIASRALLNQLPADIQEIAREFDKTTLKGKSEPMVIYDFPWQEKDLTKIKQVAPDNAITSLRLGYRDHTTLFNSEDCPFSLGRAINNLFVVDSDTVSRRHVSIEFLRGRFVLSDKSTNGSYVYPDHGEEIYLRREQIPLWGKGRICLGAPETEPLDHTVEYSCETTDQS